MNHNGDKLVYDYLSPGPNSVLHTDPQSFLYGLKLPCLEMRPHKSREASILFDLEPCQELLFILEK